MADSIPYHEPNTPSVRVYRPKVPWEKAIGAGVMMLALSLLVGWTITQCLDGPWQVVSWSQIDTYSREFRGIATAKFHFLARGTGRGDKLRMQSVEIQYTLPGSYRRSVRAIVDLKAMTIQWDGTPRPVGLSRQSVSFEARGVQFADAILGEIDKYAAGRLPSSQDATGEASGTRFTMKRITLFAHRAIVIRAPVYVPWSVLGGVMAWLIAGWWWSRRRR